MREPQQILIFGGSFNPPTLAHEAIIAACLAMSQFDEVWVMPSGERSDKQIATSDEHRMQLLHDIHAAQFNSTSRLHISDFELRLPRPTATHQTLRELSAAHPDKTFWFAFGGDSFRSMHTWPNAADFMTTIRSLVFTDEHIEEEPGRIVHARLPFAVSDVSSTRVRELSAAGKDVSLWVSEPVLRYMKAHNLYL